MTWRTLCAFLCTACVCACADPAPSPPPPSGPMPPGIVARIGDVEITADAVARIAAAQGVPPARALERAISDALFTAEARARGLDDNAAVHADIHVVLARRLLRSLHEEAERAGPVTDTELREITARRWLDLDRPEGFRTVHAVVRVAENADAALRDKARAVAEAILAAVAPVRELARGSEPPRQVPGRRLEDPAADAFIDASGKVSAEGLEVTRQTLPAVTMDGRVLTPEPQQFDLAFSRAAAALAARGDISPLVTSPFGFHVIMLLERIPAASIPEEERRRMVREEVVTERARAAHRRLLDELGRRPVSIDDSADAIMALIRIGP